MPRQKVQNFCAECSRKLVAGNCCPMCDYGDLIQYQSEFHRRPSMHAEEAAMQAQRAQMPGVELPLCPSERVERLETLAKICMEVFGFRVEYTSSPNRAFVTIEVPDTATVVDLTAKEVELLARK